MVSPLIGEPLPLDLVNTSRNAAGEGGDALEDVAGLENWLLAEADRLPMVRVTPHTLDAVRELRSHVATLIEAARSGVRPPADALAGLNAALRAAPSFAQLSWDDGWRLDGGRSGDPDALLVAALAEATAEFLAGPMVDAIRECAAPDCALLFAATHPRRRWCSATVCGNRIRVARYYARHRFDRAI
ncbi:MAG: CGNR zinc finger domain-containing protein [Acidothermus sp.]|nr:CGNR zinc finger domain-containing protein [Acidothermus sp.]